jgi:hypothetical protein
MNIIYVILIRLHKMQGEIFIVLVHFQDMGIIYLRLQEVHFVLQLMHTVVVQYLFNVHRVHL